MKKIYVLFLLLAGSYLGSAQSYPYLNASTDNMGQMAVDKDTNLFMFQGKQLEKLDKNLNVLWAKTYSGIYFQSLLLSKTGSIFFKARDTTSGSYSCYGKLDSQGNIAWIRTLKNFTTTITGTTTVGSWSCNRIMLDKDNNLLLAGIMSYSPCNSFLIKSDTSGNIIKVKCFDPVYSQNFDLLMDSAGVYRFAGVGTYLGGTLMSTYRYSDLTNTFLSARPAFIGPYNFNVSFHKSKMNGSFYVVGYSTNTFNVCHILKFNYYNLKWGANISSPGITNCFFQGIEEDEKGNVLYQISSGPASPSYTSGVILLDSNGVGSTSLMTMLKSYPVGPFPPKIPASNARAIHNNNYFFDVYGYSFPTNPLTVQKFSSTLTYSCSATIAITRTVNSTGTMSMTVPSVYNVSAYTLTPLTSIATPLSFSVNPNYCIVLGENGIEKGGLELVIYPNPAQHSIRISTTGIIETVNLFDVNGRNIFTSESGNEIDLREFPSGIYFLKIKTDRGEVNRKFIKE